jgi:hypothetical protein
MMAIFMAVSVKFVAVYNKYEDQSVAPGSGQSLGEWDALTA